MPRFVAEQWNKAFEGKHVVLLGGTGSLGKELASYIIKHRFPLSKLSIYSRGELRQLEMMEDFPENPRLNFMIGDVRDSHRLSEALEGVHIVIHAAAMKHVVMCEMNPGECWKTNVGGTKNVIEACVSANVEQALLISTDKAENPLGIYGKSKAAAEQDWLEANTRSQQPTFGVVRLGNIIGSRGSVWEAFKKQRKHGVLKVTHPEATRFFIDKERAVKFVMEQLVALETDRICYPEMNAIRILDLAKQLCPECTIEYTGLRPGDKLHEDLGGKSSGGLVVQHNLISSS